MGLALAAVPAPASTNLSVWAFPGASGRILRQPDALGNRVLDYSGVGYKGGTVPLPVVPVKVTISPVAGDNVANVQNAINQVAALPLDANGFRGAVLLTAGEYPLSATVKISASGVVLRGVGSGADGTVLRATATNQYTLVSIAGSGSASTVGGTTHNITNNYVPVGARSVYVDSTSGLAVNDRVFARRVATSNWISDLGMDLLCCAPDVNAWTPSGYHMDFDRVITRIEGNHIFLDAPLTCAIDAGRYTNGTIRKYTWSGRISNCGVEHLRGVSDYASPTDENHGWTFVQFNTIENGWARDVTSQYFGYSCVSLGSGARFVTVADCQCLDPISIITGGRRYAFVMDDNTMCLVQNCYTRLDRHQFVTQSLTTGPNVFVDGLSDSAQSDAGPHHRWGTGALWDNVVVNGDNINVQNRGNLGSGHGWAGANEVVWDCRAGGFVVQNPPGARNWLIGSVGAIQNGTVYVGPHAQGTYDSSGSGGAPVFPNSLYYAQLQERLAGPNLQTYDHWLGDMDAFTNAAGAGLVPVDAAWLAAIQAAAVGAPVDGFDVVTTGHWVPFTFNFTVAAGEKIVGASLAVSLLAAASGSTNEALLLDSTNTALPFDSLGWLPISTTATNPSVRMLDLAGQLDLLADGKLNVAVRDDVGVDWAMLELKVAKTFNAITNILMPAADAFVRGGTYAGNNFAGSTALTLKEDSSADNDRKAYLRWDLAGMGGTLLQAKVRLTPVDVGTNGLEHGVALAGSDAWTESGLTWNNQPGAGKRFATWIPALTGPVEFVVTPQVQDAFAGGQQLSLQIYSLYSVGGPGYADYASSRDPNPPYRPQLILLFDGIKWNGNLSGAWNTNTANWLTLAAGASSVYHETTPPGDAVLFDDTAVGTTLVSVVNSLSPAAMTVNNTSRAYALTGTGRLNAGLLTKQGSSALTLGNSGSSYFAAGITLGAGLVQVVAPLAAAAVRFATPSGATASLNLIGTSATIGGDISAGAGADALGLNSTVLGLAGSVGTALAPLGSLALTNSTLTLPAARGVTNAFVTTLTTGGATNWINVASIAGLTAYPAQLPLIRYSGAIAGGGYNFSLGTVPAGVGAYLSNNVAAGSIDLVVTSAADAGPPLWTGAVNGDWDLAATFNWKGTLSGLPVAYQDGEAVRFDDSANGVTTVNLTTAVSPASIIVTNAVLSYSFTGTGRLSGPGQLLKQGSGTLIVGNSGVNDFAGGVNLSGGTLRLSGGSNRLPTNSAVVVANTAGAVLDLNSQAQTIGSLSGGGPAGGNVALGSAALVVNGGAGSIFAGAISGSGSLTLAGGSALTLSGANSYSGSTTIADGVLRAASSSALGTAAGSTTINNPAGARLELAGGITLAEPLNIACKGSALNGVPAVENISGTNTLTGLVRGNTGGSDWTFQVDAGRLLVAGDFTNAATTNTRNIKLRGPGDGEWSGDIGNGVGSNTEIWKDGTGTWVLSGSNSYQGPTVINEGTIQIGKGSTTGNLGTGAVTDNSALVFKRSDTAVVTNSISGAGTVAQNGAGVTSLTASNVYTGPTFVNAGVLSADNLAGSATGSGDVTVNAGGTLSGSGSVAGAVTIRPGATIAPGAGVGSLSTGPQAWDGGGVYSWQISQPTGSAGANWDLLRVAGDCGVRSTMTNPFIIKTTTAGLTGFDRATNYTWAIATATRITNFSSTAFTIDTARFTNDLAGGYFLVRTGAGALNLLFTNNHPPVAGTATYTRPPGAVLQIPVADLLASTTSDPDGDPRALVSVSGSTNGASLTVSNDFIYYVPSSAGPDRFSFTVRDVRTNPPAAYRPTDTVLTATGTVLVQISADAGFRLLSVVATGPGTNELQFAGLAGQPYAVQFATNLNLPVNWLALLNATAGFDGRFTVLDSLATNVQRYYRVLTDP